METTKLFLASPLRQLFKQNQVHQFGLTHLWQVQQLVPNPVNRLEEAWIHTTEHTPPPGSWRGDYFYFFILITPQQLIIQKGHIWRNLSVEQSDLVCKTESLMFFQIYSQIGNQLLMQMGSVLCLFLFISSKWNGFSDGSVINFVE